MNLVVEEEEEGINISEGGDGGDMAPAETKLGGAVAMEREKLKTMRGKGTMCDVSQV